MSTKGLLQVMSFSFSYVAIGVRLFGPPGQCGPRFARSLQFSFRKFFLILSAPPDQTLLIRPLGRRRELFRLRRFSALMPNFSTALNPLGFSHFFGVVHGGAMHHVPPFLSGPFGPSITALHRTAGSMVILDHRPLNSIRNLSQYFRKR